MWSRLELVQFRFTRLGRAFIVRSGVQGMRFRSSSSTALWRAVCPAFSSFGFLGCRFPRGYASMVCGSRTAVTGVSQPKSSSTRPLTISKNLFWISSVIGPAVALADDNSVHRSDRSHFGGGSGEEHLVGDV